MLCSNELSTCLHSTWPVTNILILVEDQTVRTSSVVLDGALTYEVHGAVVLVPVEADLAFIVHTELLLLQFFVLLGVVGALVAEGDHVTLQLFGHGF